MKSLDPYVGNGNDTKTVNKSDIDSVPSFNEILLRNGFWMAMVKVKTKWEAQIYCK